MAQKAKKAVAVVVAPPAVPVLSMPVMPSMVVPSIPGLPYEELTAFGRDTIEAATKSNAAFSAGCEAIGQEVMAYTRSTIEQTSETARALLAARTFEDVMRLQTDLAKRSFECLVSGSAKLSELGATLASATLAPWNGRVETVLAQFAKPLAA